MEAYQVHYMQNKIIRVSQLFQNVAGHSGRNMLMPEIGIIAPIRLPYFAERLACVMK
ncbi:hypothetical protein D3C73_1618320 [compost metagenome]